MVIERVDAAVVTIALMTVEYAYIEDINPTASDSPAVNASNSGHFNGDCRIFSDPKVIHHVIVDISNPSKGTFLPAG